jgi:hypothetical protein
MFIILNKGVNRRRYRIRVNDRAFLSNTFGSDPGHLPMPAIALRAHAILTHFQLPYLTTLLAELLIINIDYDFNGIVLGLHQNFKTLLKIDKIDVVRDQSL